MNIIGALRVRRVRRDREAVDELVRALGRQDVLELLVLLVEHRGLAAPDDAEVDVAVQQRRLRAVGVVDLDERQPLLRGSA